MPILTALVTTLALLLALSADAAQTPTPPTPPVFTVTAAPDVVKSEGPPSPCKDPGISTVEVVLTTELTIHLNGIPIHTYTHERTETQERTCAVDCVMTDWVLDPATVTWQQCDMTGNQMGEELWSRTVTTIPIGTGLACGALLDPRPVTRTCTVPGLPLLNAADFELKGSFRVPLGPSSGACPILNLTYGGTALTYTGHDTLYIVGHDWCQLAAEISIPTPSLATTVAALPRATFVQPITDVLQGKLKTVDGLTQNGTKIGAVTPFGVNKLGVTAWNYYDNQPGKLSYFIVNGRQFATLKPTDVTGPFQLGLGYPGEIDPNKSAGFVSNYMTAIPLGYQSVLGGDYLVGNCCISVIERSSHGPSLSVITLNDIGVKPPTQNIVLAYPTNHKTLGGWGIGGGLGLYNGTQWFRGVFFPEGTRSVLVVGWGGTTFCYGAGTPDPAKHNVKLPPPSTQHYCYDPYNPAATGTHGYPYRSLVFAYNVDDLAAARKGTKKPWEVVPYTTWELPMPFQRRLNAAGEDIGSYDLRGAAWDAARKLVYLVGGQQDGAMPLIHVFELKTPVTVPAKKN